MAQTSDVGNAVVDIVRVNMFDLDNNYGWLVRDKSSSKVAAIDPAQPEAIQQALEARSWSLDYILNTHHHYDHVGGNSYLKSTYGCTIVGFAEDAERIPLMDVGVAEGDNVAVGDLRFQIIEVPGHTRGHIAFWEESAAVLFPGDTLFAMGCGRLFEGTPEQMWTSLKKLKVLPANTGVYCAHEYTQNNARWAVTVEPDNKDLLERKVHVDELRSQGIPTVPTTIADELKTNPFMRPDSAGIRSTLGVASSASDETAFAAIRKHKDNF
eukprot:jgi/Ulvmu1/3194/UM015_0235.1